MKKYLPYFLILPSLIVGIFIGRFTTEKPPTSPNIPNPYPQTATVQRIIDGDTIVLNLGQDVRLNGINAPDGNTPAKAYLDKILANNKTVYLEYDRPPKDQYDRLLAWVWIDCESDPEFLDAKYMHKSQNESMPGLVDNPEGCKNGKLVNEELVKNGFAKVEVYDKRGELKYQKRISKITLPQ